LDLALPYLPDTESVLEVGCGVGRVLQFVAPCFDKAWGVDVSDKYIELSKPFLASCSNVTTSLSDGMGIPSLEGSPFSMIYCVFVLDHIPSYDIGKSLLKAMVDNCKQDGTLILFVGVHPDDPKGSKDFGRVGTTWTGFRWTKQIIDTMLADLGLAIMAYRVGPVQKMTQERLYAGIISLWQKGGRDERF